MVNRPISEAKKRNPIVVSPRHFLYFTAFQVVNGPLFSLHCTILYHLFFKQKKSRLKNFRLKNATNHGKVGVYFNCISSRLCLFKLFLGGFTDKLPDSSHHGPLTTETQKGLQWLLVEALCNALEGSFSKTDPFSSLNSFL